MKIAIFFYFIAHALFSLYFFLLFTYNFRGGHSGNIERLEKIQRPALGQFSRDPPQQSVQKDQGKFSLGIVSQGQ